MDLSPRGDEAARLAERVGVPLRTARLAAGLSMRALSMRAGISDGTVSKLERGVGRPSRTVLTKLARALHPGDATEATRLLGLLVVGAGPSLAVDTMPASIARELVVEVLGRSLAALGLSLDDAVRRVTATPAQSTPLENELGTLKLGAWGDAVVFDLQKGNFEYWDSDGQVRTGKQRLVPVNVVRAGRIYHPE